MQKRQFLALTALEDFWDISRPIIFLGEWCRKYDRKNHWETLDARVMHPMQFEQKTRYDYHCEAVLVYEKLLPIIAKNLNIFHQTQHSLKYWRLLIGPFLFWYTQVVYDRYLYLKAAYAENPELETYGISKASYLTPLDTNELLGFAQSNDGWNLQLFTQLIDLAFKRPIQYKAFLWEKEHAQRNKNCEQESYRFRTRLLLYLARAVNYLRRGKIVGLLDNHFSLKQSLQLAIGSRFRILPLLPARPLNRGQSLGCVETSQAAVDVTIRHEIFNVKIDDILSTLVMSTLSVNMPAIFIERYENQIKLSQRYFPYRFSVLFHEQCGAHDKYKFWIGAQMEKGAKLIGHQHGGAYGMYQGHAGEYIERQVSDFFISWGWSSRHVIPMPVINISQRLSHYYRNTFKRSLRHIVWVATIGGVAYSKAFCDWQLAQVDYIRLQNNFFSRINSDIIETLYMRASPTPHCQAQIDTYLKGVNILKPKDRNSFFADIDSAKIVVIDHPVTSFLFTLAFNIPTILFWNKKDWPMQAEAEPFIAMLEHAEIYHDSPEGAAVHLNTVSDDLESWWMSEVVQTARRHFCDQFARSSPHFLAEWRDILTYI